MTIALFLLGSAGTGWAQKFPDSLLTHMGADQVIRLRLSDGDRFETQVTTVGRERDTLYVQGRTQPVVLTDIDSLWIQGSASKNGALIGGLVAGVSALAVAVAVIGMSDETGSSGSAVAALGGAVLVGGVGAVIGAAIGSGVPKWKFKYARPSVSLAGRGRAVGARVSFSF